MVVAAVAVALAGLGWFTVSSQASSTCEACVVYRGREACRTASASTRQQAEQYAQSTACALVTGGVTEDLECQRSLPVSLRCE